MRFIDWFFRDRRTGRITIAQLPNVPLWIFLGAAILRLVVPSPSGARTILEWVGDLALAWWAVDEVARGVNPWRRLLGAAGCVISVAALVGAGVSRR